MNSSESDREQTCGICGAMVAPGAPFCWLCREAIQQLDAEARAAAPPPVVVEPRAPYQFGLSTLFLVMTLFAITLSVFSIEPGLGMCLAVLSLPPMIRTCLVVYRRKTQGRNVKSVEKIGLYLASFFLTVIILAILGAAAFATFFVVCLGTYEFADEATLPLASLAAIVVTILLCWPTFLLIRHRWRRDIRKADENGGSAPLQEDGSKEAEA